MDGAFLQVPYWTNLHIGLVIAAEDTDKLSVVVEGRQVHSHVQESQVDRVVERLNVEVFNQCIIRDVQVACLRGHLTLVVDADDSVLRHRSGITAGKDIAVGTAVHLHIGLGDLRSRHLVIDLSYDGICAAVGIPDDLIATAGLLPEYIGTVAAAEHLSDVDMFAFSLFRRMNKRLP